MIRHLHVYRFRSDGSGYKVARFEQVVDATAMCEAIERQGDTPVINPSRSGPWQNVAAWTVDDSFATEVDKNPPWRDYLSTREGGDDVE